MTFFMSIVSLTFLMSHTAFAWTSWVGVLEDWPILEPSPDQAGNSDQKTNPNSSKVKISKATFQPKHYEPRVRPLFIRIDNKPWQAAPNANDPNPSVPLPKNVSWDVCFSGRNDGQLTASLNTNTNTNEAKLTPPPYVLRSEDRAPWRTRRSVDYAGSLEIPVYKPVVLKCSLSSSCNDPEKWRKGSIERARPFLKPMIEQLKKQREGNQDHPSSSNLNDAQVKIIGTWISPREGIIVSLRPILKSRETETFRVDSNKGIHYLGRNMQFIDAGDFDGDGRSEMLFKRHKDGKDSYELYANNQRLAESVWE